MGGKDEIVVSDDGSTDETLAIIRGLHDDRIKVYTFTQPSETKHPHEYVCRNFENALKHAKGNFIFLSDQDDEWLPNKVAICIKDLQEHDLVLHDFMHVDELGNVIKPLHYDGRFRPHNYFLMHGIHYGCALALRREVLDYVLPFPRHILLHDHWIGILVETLGRFYYEPEPLIKYRIHTQNTSRIKNTLAFKVTYRLRTMVEVAKRVMRYKIFTKV